MTIEKLLANMEEKLHKNLIIPFISFDSKVVTRQDMMLGI